MLPSFGWSTRTYFGCLDDLWDMASGWGYNAESASGAYGIPLALPGSKMASAGPDHPESTYLEETPIAQLTRIDAVDRLFSVPLTRITGVP